MAGTAGTAGSADGAAGSATFSGPRGLWSDGLTYLYVVDQTTGLIRRVRLDTGAVSTLPTPGFAFNAPFAIWSDGNALYVTNSSNHTVSKLVP